MAGKKESQTQIALRIDDSLLGRADKLAENMSQPGMPVTRTEVLRLATHRGIDQLEQGVKIAGKKR